MLPYGTRRRRSFEMILKLPVILRSISRTDVFTKENISQSIRYIRLYGISGFTEKITEKLEKRGYRVNRYFLEAVKRTHLDEEPWKSITLQPCDKDTSMLEICNKLKENYPGYSEITGDFANADSLKEIQEALEVLVDYHTKGAKKLYSFIEHMGGGSDFFVQSLTEQLMKKGIITMRFRYDFSEKTLVLIYHNGSLKREFAFAYNGTNQLKDFVDFFKYDYIFINQMISWPNVMDIIHFLIEVNVPYVIFAHDNFYLCPSWNLINDEGRFCNLPDLTVCKNCLPNNKFSSHNLYYRSFFDISQWRRKMHGFLQNAKYIISPSESMKNHLLKVYEDLQNVVVLEHFESAFPYRNIRRHFTGNELVVGILGDIGYHKGDKLLKKLVARLKSKALPIKIVVIGYTRSFPAPYKSADGKFFIHGRYNRLDLPDLLERYNVNVILIPSICPETFSYTISEAMLLRYPLVCFNIGAQAERVRKYNCGIIVNDISVEGLVAALKELLQNPGLIETFSSHASKFVPQSGQEYMERLLKLLVK
jgi:glycosyltransferase involved in cell wall biosynthesis